ncbi:septation protein A [Parapusillimonas granuli]|uniref:Inner membrane-spanning protein YciB n=1 Tax=Parapusillimonas granuli TaxID=380911 RepID=A0A853G789_9BURK|nr:septation protein A [Parapusillimonas granuli]MBB5216734.1 intracellular septation protein [Parapusillimonas granuli]MEB2400063.1 septation protein A [Alcaligenaceae bacterium]NYT51622.1 septation protein A [Parapusillimonas granuli]
MKKFLFDLFPLILFFVAFKFYDIFTATAVAIAAAVAQFVWLKATGKAIEATHWINLTVIVVFGGATLLFKNDAFIKWKPTVLYWLFALILLGGKLFFKRNLMQKLMGEKVSMPPAIWDKMNYSWSAFFVASGALNLYVAFSGHYTEAQWVNFKVFGLMALLLVFVVGQSIWLGRHMKDAGESADALSAAREPKEGR